MTLNFNLPSILHRFQVTAHYMSNFCYRQEGVNVTRQVQNANCSVPLQLWR